MSLILGPAFIRESRFFCERRIFCSARSLQVSISASLGAVRTNWSCRVPAATSVAAWGGSVGGFQRGQPHPVRRPESKWW